MPAFDDFTEAFAEFMESGTVKNLLDYYDSDTNSDYINIYRNGYYRSVIDTLVSNYPAVHALIGSEMFRHLAKKFVFRYPPVVGTLVGYGVEFPCFLETADIISQIPYLPDIARLDRGWLKVYFSADRQSLSPASVSELINQFGDAGLEKVVLVPAVELVSLGYPVTGLWQFLKDNNHLETITPLAPIAEHTLIWRRGNVVLVRVLPAVEFVFFSGLITGLNLEDAVKIINSENDGLDLSLFFADLIKAGLLSVKREIHTD